MKIREFSYLVCLLLGLLSQGRAQDSAPFPIKMITMICPWAPGGGTDQTARFFATQLERELGKPVVVVNKTGGSGAVGHTAGASARPDGYTITLGTFELTTMRHMGVAPLSAEDFTPLMQVNADPAALLVRQDAPWHSLTELLAEVRQKPGQLKFSGTAAGGTWDLARAGLLLAAKLPVDSVLWVPTQGSKPALADLLGGHIEVVCCALGEAKSQIESGQLRPLTLMARERSKDFPEVKTAREEGVEWDTYGWRGVLAPKGLPQGIAEKLIAALRKAVESEACRDFAKKNGFGIEVKPGEQFAQFLREQDTQWKGLVQAAGFGGKSLKPKFDPGPYALPKLLALLLLLGTAWEIAKGRRVARSATALAERQPISRTAIILVLALVVYVILLPWLGFAPTTLLFGLLMMMGLGLRAPFAFGMSLLLVAVIMLLFGQVFRVPLPEGFLGM